ncbi:uncharacterized protein LOC121600996 isoform X2 [Anopheles merus]|uniref:uncharacterized protein LOC121600996 isoform X2 n=1 Tax=Anopheles merus TaxID=30066 RepID=UPI001BE3E1A4|nr:uncharacterized protein LOC121600996 isoform X2 [Anopheles merus]
MASRSYQYRKRRRFMEEVEREIENEINNMETSSPVMVPASTSRMFNELHSTDSNLGYSSPQWTPLCKRLAMGFYL